MKTLKKILFVIGLLICSSNSFAQVGINTSSPEAQLDVRSSNQAAPSNTDGLLIPKVDAFPAVNPTAAQQGMMVYLTTTSGSNAPGFYYWDNTTTSWTSMAGSKGWDTVGNVGTNPATNFIGTKDNQDLVIRTNNAENVRFKTNGFMGVGTSSPLSKFHVTGITTGMTPYTDAIATLDNTTGSYLNLLSNEDSGIMFGANGSGISGSIIYNHPAIPEGFLFRNGGNQTKMILLANGYLGLGNSIPNYPLQLDNSFGDKISLWGTAGPSYGFGVQNNLLQVHTQTSSGDIAFGYGASAAFTEAMRVKGNGNVGIATTSPQSKLHVVAGSSGAVPNGFSVATLEGGTSGYLSILSMQETGLIFGGNGTSTNGSIVFNNPAIPNGYAFRTGGNQTKMIMTANGYLGVGHNSVPNFPLQLDSVLGDKISLWGTAGNHYGFGIQTGLMQIHTNTSGGDIAFGYGQSSAFSETMRIKGTGNVGIATNNPLSKLHVFNGASGMTPNSFAGATVEGNGFTYINVLSTTETGIVFGSAGNNTNGGIVYNSGVYSNGMNFRTGGNQNRMSISSTGNVSVGNALADAKFHVMASNQAAPANTDGMIIPKIDAFPAINPTASQNSMMVYLTTTASGNLPGFYYWDNASTSWKGVGTSANWGMKGNAGTSAATNFIGTTDDNDLVFKRNNVQAGKLGTTATGFGTSALLNNTAAGSTAVGNNAMLSNTWGLYNSAFGADALHTNASGWYNTATGFNALYYNTASYNTATGVNALLQNTTGESNTAVGFESLRDNTQGHHNTAIGWGAMAQGQTGEQNTAIGVSSLYSNSAGTHNVAVGMNTIANNSAGISNTALGTGAMFAQTGGNNNVALGMEAMNGQTTGSNNIAIGKGANLPSLIGSDQLSIGNVIYGTGMASTSSFKMAIGDTAPDAKLEIAASNAAAPSNTDGILIPRVSAFPITNPTASQNGMMVYLTNTIGFYQSGFYYWDNASSSWLAVGSKSNWSTSGNSGTNPAGNFMGTNDNVDFAIRTNSTERMRITSSGDVGIRTSTPTTDFEVNGYTKLGSAAPAIKIAKVTGTTSSSVGGSVSVLHGVTTTKIISVSVLVEHAANSYMFPGFTASAGYEFNYYINGGNIFVVNKSGNSANILSKPFKIVVTYEE